MKKILISSLLCAGILLLASCATSISMKVQRPAELDLRGANSISVIPFQISKPSSADNNEFVKILKFIFTDRKDPRIDIAEHLTSTLTDKLIDSNYMDVISSSAVLRALENGTAVPADCYLTGYISKFKTDEEVFEKEDDEGNVEYSHRRNVNLTIVYQVIDSNSYQIICSKTKEISEHSSRISADEPLPDAYSIVRYELDYLINQIMKELQPYEETKYLTLLDDKEYKDLMKPAKELASKNKLDEALDKYLSLYKQYNIFAAGYNAALIIQAKGNLSEAEKLMIELADKFKDKKAVYALDDIHKEMELNNKLNNQISSKENK